MKMGKVERVVRHFRNVIEKSKKGGNNNTGFLSGII